MQSLVLHQENRVLMELELKPRLGLISATECDLPHFIRTIGKNFLRVSARSWSKVGRRHWEHAAELSKWYVRGTEAVLFWRYEQVMETSRGMVQYRRARVPVDRVWGETRTEMKRENTCSHPRLSNYLCHNENATAYANLLVGPWLVCSYLLSL